MLTSIIITIGSALISGLIGVLIGTWLNRHYEDRKAKIKIMEILVTYRWAPLAQERITALNIIPIVFYKDVGVCSALDRYKKAHEDVTDNLNNPAVLPKKFNTLYETYIKIVEAIINNLKLDSTIDWDNLKEPLIPKYYVDDKGVQQWY